MENNEKKMMQSKTASAETSLWKTELVQTEFRYTFNCDCWRRQNEIKYLMNELLRIAQLVDLQIIKIRTEAKRAKEMFFFLCAISSYN